MGVKWKDMDQTKALQSERDALAAQVEHLKQEMEALEEELDNSCPLSDLAAHVAEVLQAAAERALKVQDSEWITVAILGKKGSER